MIGYNIIVLNTSELIGIIRLRFYTRTARPIAPTCIKVLTVRHFIQ